MIYVTPISTYDYDNFVSMVKSKYGIAPSKISFPVDITDKENPKCGNCKTIVKVFSTANKYCHNCGCELDWTDADFKPL